MRMLCCIVVSCFLVIVPGCEKSSGSDNIPGNNDSNSTGIGTVAGTGSGNNTTNSGETEIPLNKKVKVYEYLPAPGQFINEGYEADSMEQACEYAEDRLNSGKDLSLGSFGGYVIVGFSSPVVGMPHSHEIGIKSNQSPSSSEPGIVLVSRDLNDNGMPDDPWFELTGELYYDKGTWL